jgi:SOS-response transcriptional repressor LexA
MCAEAGGQRECSLHHLLRAQAGLSLQLAARRHFDLQLAQVGDARTPGVGRFDTYTEGLSQCFTTSATATEMLDCVSRLHAPIVGTATGLSIGVPLGIDYAGFIGQPTAMPRPMRILPAKVVAAREEMGWSRNELARRAKLAQPSLRSIEKGITKEVKYSTISKIASATGKDLAFFTGNIAMEGDVPQTVGVVPIISWVQAGNKNAVADPYPPGAAEDWEEVTVPASKLAFALRVRGDSMFKPEGISFPDGTVIVVEPEMDARMATSSWCVSRTRTRPRSSSSLSTVG